MIQEQSGVHLRLAAFLHEFGRLTGDEAVIRATGQPATEPLTPATLRLLAEATIAAVADGGRCDAGHLVAIGREMVEDADRASADRRLSGSRRARLLPAGAGDGPHPRARARRWIHGGRRDPGRPRDPPPDSPAGAIGLELLVPLIDERFPLAALPDIGTTAAATAVARAVVALRRAVTELGQPPGDLDDAVNGLPETYPLTSRLRAALGAALVATRRPDAVGRGAGLLRTLARQDPGNDALAALAGHAALFAVEAAGATAEDAIALLSEPGPLGSAWLARARASGDESDLAEAITLLERAARDLDPSGSPVADIGRVGTDLAEAYRMRGDLGGAVQGGLATLRTMVTAGAPGTERLASRLAGWCVADGWLPGAVEAIELGLHGHPDSELPYGLAPVEGSLDDSRRMRAERGQSPDVGAPSVERIGTALCATGADALVYLAVAAGRAVVVTSEGRTVAGPALAGLTGAHRHPPERWHDQAATVVAELARYRRVVLVVTGDLRALPWHAARVGDRHLVTSTAVSYSPSASMFVEVAGRPSGSVYARPIFVTAAGGTDARI